MKILALDLSIKCPGWCVADDDIYISSGYREHKVKGLSVYERIEANLELIAGLVRENDIKAVWAENTMPSGRGLTSQMLIEQAGIVKYWCRVRGLPFYAFEITDIKKYVSGKGNAGKPEMLVAVRALGYDVAQNDEVDAIAVWLTGLGKAYSFVANE
jgi:Holliday junction resolvasome RuvABC endonuclease subunit